MAETAQDASAPLSRQDKMKDEDMDEGARRERAGPRFTLARAGPLVCFAPFPAPVRPLEGKAGSDAAGAFKS